MTPGFFFAKNHLREDLTLILCVFPSKLRTKKSKSGKEAGVFSNPRIFLCWSRSSKIRLKNCSLPLPTTAPILFSAVLIRWSALIFLGLKKILKCLNFYHLPSIQKIAFWQIFAILTAFARFSHHHSNASQNHNNRPDNIGNVGGQHAQHGQKRIQSEQNYQQRHGFVMKTFAIIFHNNLKIFAVNLSLIDPLSLYHKIN